MLVLTRRQGERIRIGADVVITVVRIDAHTVRIGIDAPRAVSIVRTELLTEHTDARPEPDPN